jgi:hypothetical protein
VGQVGQTGIEELLRGCGFQSIPGFYLDVLSFSGYFESYEKIVKVKIDTCLQMFPNLIV